MERVDNTNNLRNDWNFNTQKHWKQLIQAT